MGVVENVRRRVRGKRRNGVLEEGCLLPVYGGVFYHVPVQRGLKRQLVFFDGRAMLGHANFYLLLAWMAHIPPIDVLGRLRGRRSDPVASPFASTLTVFSLRFRIGRSPCGISMFARKFSFGFPSQVPSADLHGFSVSKRHVDVRPPTPQ